MSAKQFNYFDDYQSLILECPKCHWQGTFEQGSVETYDDQMDSACPKCDFSCSPILAVVLYPTTEELVANADRPGVRDWILMIEKAIESQNLGEASQNGEDKLAHETDTLSTPTTHQIQSQLPLNFEVHSQTSDEQQLSSERGSVERRAMRPVPGVPGAAWERTEYGTKLVLEPNSEFDSLPEDEQNNILDRIVKCMDAPYHIDRVSALRDEFSGNTGQKKAGEREE
jgi:hypothetical protein